MVLPGAIRSFVLSRDKFVSLYWRFVPPVRHGVSIWTPAVKCYFLRRDSRKILACRALAFVVS